MFRILDEANATGQSLELQHGPRRSVSRQAKPIPQTPTALTIVRSTGIPTSADGSTLSGPRPSTARSASLPVSIARRPQRIKECVNKHKGKEGWYQRTGASIRLITDGKGGG
jgi:hypothetical protein